MTDYKVFSYDDDGRKRLEYQGDCYHKAITKFAYTHGKSADMLEDGEIYMQRDHDRLTYRRDCDV